jgi:hypothetical protein
MPTSDPGGLVVCGDGGRGACGGPEVGIGSGPSDRDEMETDLFSHLQVEARNEEARAGRGLGAGRANGVRTRVIAVKEK